MERIDIGNQLIQAMNEAIEYARGQNKNSRTHKIKVPDNINVAKIRKKTGLSRVRFAEQFGFSPKTLQHWEQGDRKPSGPARILLAILEKDPDVIYRYLELQPSKQKYTCTKSYKKVSFG